MNRARPGKRNWKFWIASAVLLAAAFTGSRASHAQESPAQSPTLEASNDTSTDTTSAPDIEASIDADAALETTDPDALAQVIVSGELPGPGLWKIHHGDHVLWIISTITPTPKGMKWRSREMESVVTSAKMIIGGANVSPNIGIFRALRYLPTLLRARFNPDKKKLKDLLSPEQYARWLELRKQYLKDDDDLDKYRPSIVAFMIMGDAAAKAGLTEVPIAGPMAAGIAKKNKIPWKMSNLKIDVKDPKGLLKDFAQNTSRDAEIACLIAVMEGYEKEIDLLKLRASAWAVGDIEAFRKLAQPQLIQNCFKAITSAPGIQVFYKDAVAQASTVLLADIESALTKNEVSVAFASIDEIYNAEGLIAKLRAKGYTVESPEGVPELP